MTCASSFAEQSGFSLGGLRFHRKYERVDGSLCLAWRLRSLVLIPEGKISWSKLSQALDYGAVTCQLRTDFDGCVRVLKELVKRKPVYLLNSVNPLSPRRTENSSRSSSLEQLGWEVPDHIIVPGGNLGNLPP